jgi:hypothetical protein
MIINQEKKRGRKKKVVDPPPPQKSPEQSNTGYYESTFLTNREKTRMKKYGIIGYELIVEIFNNICLVKNIPNLLIHGESGSGKSYLTNYLLHELFKSHFKERVLYMSIHDERGISTIRDKIKAFSNIQVKEYKDVPSVKVIIFDQAEYISLDAQNALRRIIETSNNITRFIFITQNTRAIIDPLLSRCIHLNLNTSIQKCRIDRYAQLFPEIPPTKIREICETYNNFGREIYEMELLQITTDYEKPTENIISDKDCDILIGLFQNTNSKMEDFIQFINCYMRNINIGLSLKKIYSCFRKCSYYFLDYEMNSNNDSNENLFLLNLFMKCKNNIEKT